MISADEVKALIIKNKSILNKNDWDGFIKAIPSSQVPDVLQFFYEHGQDAIKKLTDKIPNNVFKDNSSIRAVEIQASTIGDYAFSGCANLEAITLEDGVKTIGKAAFKDTAVKRVTIPEGVTFIGADAFAGCENLERVFLPDSLERLSSNVFDSPNLIIVANYRLKNKLSCKQADVEYLKQHLKFRNSPSAKPKEQPVDDSIA